MGAYARKGGLLQKMKFDIGAYSRADLVEGS